MLESLETAAEQALHEAYILTLESVETRGIAPTIMAGLVLRSICIDCIPTRQRWQTSARPCHSDVCHRMQLLHQLECIEDTQA